MLGDPNNKSIAVIDLGTNTFHLVLFKRTGKMVSEQYRKRHHVFLSQKGIETIAESSIERAKEAIHDFRKTLSTYLPDNTLIVGTEALRVASNGPDLAAFIEETLNAKVEIISGEREAELIAKGVQWESKAPIDNALIMDIGGGSVEFIHIKNQEIKWLDSFPVGVGVLHNKFKHEEPIEDEEVENLEDYLKNNCKSLVDYLASQEINYLIGASGSFELISAIKQGKYPPELTGNEVDIADFWNIHNLILHSSLADRLDMKGLPSQRAKLIVVAFILMGWIIRTMPATKLTISKYAVKEGLVAEELLDF